MSTSIAKTLKVWQTFRVYRKTAFHTTTKKNAKQVQPERAGTLVLRFVTWCVMALVYHNSGMIFVTFS